MQRHVLTVEDLQQQFISYQTAFRKLILEIARRRVYKEAAENIVRGMMDQLTAMTEGSDSSTTIAKIVYKVELTTPQKNDEYGNTSIRSRALIFQKIFVFV